MIRANLILSLLKPGLNEPLDYTVISSSYPNFPSDCYMLQFFFVPVFSRIILDMKETVNLHVSLLDLFFVWGAYHFVTCHHGS